MAGEVAHDCHQRSGAATIQMLPVLSPFEDRPQIERPG
jgi:hypothetical protein